MRGRHSKGRISRLLIGITVTYLLSVSYVTAGELKARDIETLPLPPEMRLVGQSAMKKGIIVREYCSSKRAGEVLEYFKSSLNNFVEIEMDTVKGHSTKLLLDVRSPADWRKSREFIEILTPHKKISGCRTTVYISGSRIAKETDKTEATKGMAPAGKKEHEMPRTKLPEFSNFIGFGAFVNSLNFSIGPTLMIWPTDSFAIQGTYGVGTFTSFEARALFRWNLPSKVRPYFGAGYVHAEKEETVLGVDKTIEGESFTAFAGAELKLGKHLFAYMEVGGTPLDVETEFLSGSTKVKATVKYSPVTVNAALIFYLW